MGGVATGAVVLAVDIQYADSISSLWGSLTWYHKVCFCQRVFRTHASNDITTCSQADHHIIWLDGSSVSADTKRAFLRRISYTYMSGYSQPACGYFNPSMYPPTMCVPAFAIRWRLRNYSALWEIIPTGHSRIKVPGDGCQITQILPPPNRVLLSRSAR